MESKNELPSEGDVISTSGVFKTPFTLIILVQLFIGGLVIVGTNLLWNQSYFALTGHYYFSFEPINDWVRWILLPPSIYGNIFLFWISVVLSSALIYKILNKIYPPREGVFKRGSKEWKYTHRRFWTAYFPIWLTRALPLPWMDIATYRFFGVHIGKNVVAYEGYIDPELVDIGNFTMTSINICIFSHLIYQDKIIIKRVKIGNACVVGPQTVISPGTVMQDGAILGVNSYTNIGQELEGNLIHVGTPVSLTLPIQSLEESQEKAKKIREGTGDNQLDGEIESKNGGKSE